MGGKGSGRKATHNDLYHKLVREHQRIYDREIRAIMNEHHCGFKEAQRIRKKLRKKGKE